MDGFFFEKSKFNKRTYRVSAIIVIFILLQIGKKIKKKTK